MSIIRPRHLASVAFIALLALPAAAMAQSPPPAGSATAAPPAATAASPDTAGQSAEQRVDSHITQLHRQLQITAAERPQWNRFAAVMRDNARDMDQAIMQRAQQYSTMNALQNMQSYAKLAEAHAERMQKLVPAFEQLYNAMPEQQKKLTDQVFRENAAAHMEKRVQTGRNQ
ncbi:MAG TPA: Spy/CpxP family protein refolding chaperone [Stellaceae bacterium]|nr:Spy/CpxP family protein refolding chaperone [Stellaceae bacterium]